MTLSRPLLTIAACLFALPAVAAEVTVENAWSRATPPGAGTGAVYLTLTSKEGDTLTGVSSPAAKEASVHDMVMDGAIMRMREVQGGLALPPGRAVTLAPGGYHVMLTGLTGPLKRGGTVRLHLVFAHSPAVDVDAPIGGIGATEAPHGH